MSLSPKNRALVERLFSVKPSTSGGMRASWAEIDALLNAARAEGPAQPPLPDAGEWVRALPLLRRVMSVIDGQTKHRDAAGLDVRAHPLFDDVREYLAASPQQRGRG